jgi:uncharacterized protein (DUF3820 family)
VTAVLLWLGRMLAMMPALDALWEAARAGTPEQELAASLELLRAIKTQQAREETQGGSQ